jgi:hypothetical protein
MRFKIFTVVEMSVVVLWVVVLCGYMEGYQLFGQNIGDHSQDLFNRKRIVKGNQRYSVKIYKDFVVLLCGS